LCFKVFNISNMLETTDAMLLNMCLFYISFTFPDVALERSVRKNKAAEGGSVQRQESTLSWTKAANDSGERHLSVHVVQVAVPFHFISFHFHFHFHFHGQKKTIIMP
jgi:hypothetical protein